MEYTNALQRIGLTLKESEIYETLLDKGSLNMVKLSHLTGINRPVLYGLIPKMVSRGLIIETKKGKRVEYIASSPHKLEPLVKNAQQSLENIVTNLNNEFSKKQIVPKIETYYGQEGIIKVFMDVVITLDKGEIFYRYGTRNKVSDKRLPDEYYRIRDEKKIERVVISSASVAKRKKPKLDRQIKTLGGVCDTCNVTKLIYGKKVAFIDHENEVAFIIYNERMAKLEKEIFMNLYNRL